MSGAEPEAVRQVVGRTDGCEMERDDKWEPGKIGQSHQGEMEPMSESLSLQLDNGVASRGSQCPASCNPAVTGTEGGDPVGTVTHSLAALGQQYDLAVSDNLCEWPHSASCPSLTF